MKRQKGFSSENGKRRVVLKYLDTRGKIILKCFSQIVWEGVVQDRV
jgi:hypothetical protein